MHQSSMTEMGNFLKKHLKRGDKILDVGSAMVNVGPNLADLSYRSLIKYADMEYTGLDIEPGRNVDIVVKDPYKWTELQDETFDIVISGQAFEHIEFFWLTFQEMTRVLKTGGYMCVIAPKLCLQHKYPVDCWRFQPDGMRALAKYTGLRCIEKEMRVFELLNHVPNWSHIEDLPKDCVGVFQK